MEFEDVFADVLSTEEPTTEEPAQDAQTEPAVNEAAEQEGTGEPQEVQTEDQNAQFAAARRRAEAEFQHRMTLEQQKHTRELDELVQKAYGDQVNPSEPRQTLTPMRRSSSRTECSRQASRRR